MKIVKILEKRVKQVIVTRSFNFLLRDRRKANRLDRRTISTRRKKDLILRYSEDPHDLYFLYRRFPDLVSGLEITLFLARKDFEGKYSFRIAQEARSGDGINTNWLRTALYCKNPNSPYLKEWGMKVLCGDFVPAYETKGGKKR